jgi:hypothetical protein
VLPAPPPAENGTLRWHRGNFCGLRIPGLPNIDNGAADECLFSPHLDRYPRWVEDEAMKQCLYNGYDRIVLSWPDSRGAGQSLQQYVDQAKRWRAAGIYPMHMLLSKYYDPEDPDPAILDPVIDALLEADVLPLVSPFWEGNLFISPEAMPGIIRHVAARIGAGLHTTTILGIHFSPHYAAWQPDRPGGSGADFWNAEVDGVALCQVVDQLWYQADPEWSAGMTCARTNDVLQRLVAGGMWGLKQSVDVVPWETTAYVQFAGHMDEDHGDLKMYEQLCTPGPIVCQGYNNGSRRPGGEWL